MEEWILAIRNISSGNYDFNISYKSAELYTFRNPALSFSCNIIV